MKNILFNTLILSVFLGSSALCLHASEKRGKGNFTRADKDKDEKVSKEEFTAFYTQKKVEAEKSQALWDVSDADKDGFLTLEEWIKGRELNHKKPKDDTAKEKKKDKNEEE